MSVQSLRAIQASTLRVESIELAMNDNDANPSPGWDRLDFRN